GQPLPAAPASSCALTVGDQDVNAAIISRWCVDQGRVGRGALAHPVEREVPGQRTERGGKFGRARRDGRQGLGSRGGRWLQRHEREPAEASKTALSAIPTCATSPAAGLRSGLP